MINITYTLTLNEDQFKSLKEMVQNHYQTANGCSNTENEIYEMFNVEKSRLDSCGMLRSI